MTSSPRLFPLWSACVLLLASSELTAQGGGFIECSWPLNPKLWSDPTAWAAGTVPALDQDRTIPRGDIFVLDQDTAPLGVLTVRGTLIFDHQDLVLTANQIVIDGGVVDVGGLCGPFPAQATIAIRKPPCGAASGGYGILVQDGGSLTMVGQDVGPVWSPLATTAHEGGTVLVLQQPVSWPADGPVVLSSTDFDMNLHEEHVIDSVAGNQVTIKTGLDHEHFAGDVGTAPHTVPCRGEVALLDTNVRIVADPIDCDADPEAEYGGHIRFERTDCTEPAPVGRFQHVTFRGLGNTGQMGQYPLHFHRVGDLSASHVRDCIIDGSQNKGLVIHNSQNLEATGNVVYDTYSYAYYMEEDSNPFDCSTLCLGCPSNCNNCPELRVTGCTLSGNLGLLTRATTVEDKLHEHDTRPGTFYTRNWDNDVTMNVAAGSDAIGFYHRMPNEDLPAGARLMHDGNVAHSNGEMGWYHDDRPRLHLDPVLDGPYVQNLVSWKNREYGIWLRAYGMASLAGARVADNRSGMYLASAGASHTIPDPTAQHVWDAVIVGESPQNDESEPPSAFTQLELDHGRSLPDDVAWVPPCPTAPFLQPLTGIIDYDGLVAIGEAGATSVVFDHFRDMTAGAYTRQATAFTQINSLSPWAVDPRNFARNVELVPPGAPGDGLGVERAVLMRPWWPDQNGIATTVLFDVQGELVAWMHDHGASTPLVPGDVPTYITVDNPILHTLPGAAADPKFDAATNGWLWQPDMDPASTECMVQVEVVDCSPVTCAEPTHATFWRMDYLTDIFTPVADFRCIDPLDSSVHSFQTNVPLADRAENGHLQNVVLVTWDRVTTETGHDCSVIDLYPGCSSGPVDIPVELQVNVHFGRVGAVAYVGVPLLGPPTSVTADDTGTVVPMAPDLNVFLNATDDAWIWVADPTLLPVTQGAGVLYLKAVVEAGDEDAIMDMLALGPMDELRDFYLGAPARFNVSCDPAAAAPGDCHDCPDSPNLLGPPPGP